MLSLARAKPRSSNDAKTGEQSIFGEIHTIHAQHRTLNLQTRYLAVSLITDRQTDTQNDYRNPAAHALRVNNIIIGMQCHNYNYTDTVE